MKLVPVPNNAASLLQEGPLMASILIRNACLLPIDEAMSVIEGGWIHIEGDTIRALGAGEPPQVEGAEIVDAGGDMVMPGMVTPCPSGDDPVSRVWARMSTTGCSAMCFRWSASS